MGEESEQSASRSRGVSADSLAPDEVVVWSNAEATAARLDKQAILEDSARLMLPNAGEPEWSL